MPLALFPLDGPSSGCALLTRVTKWCYQAAAQARRGHGLVVLQTRSGGSGSIQGRGFVDRTEGSVPPSSRRIGGVPAPRAGRPGAIDVWRSAKPPSSLHCSLATRRSSPSATATSGSGAISRTAATASPTARTSTASSRKSRSSIPEPAYGYARTRQVMLNVADTKPIRLFVGDERFDLRTGQIEQYDRSLDLRQGVLSRTIRWRSPTAAWRTSMSAARLLARREIAAIDYR